MTLKRLLFIRAAETDWNLDGRWQGWVPIPLNNYGWDQAHRLAGFIRNIGVTKIYTSDNQRALQTAQALSEKLGFEAVADQRLRERHIGHWQGLILPEVREWYPDEYEMMLADLEGYRIAGGGESIIDVKKRVEPFLEQMIKSADAESDDQTIGLVSHTTTIRAMLAKLVPEADLNEENFGNTSVTTLLRNDDGGWRLIATNDTSHLEGHISRYMPEVEYPE